MKLGPTEIVDAACEAFHAAYTRLLVTAGDPAVLEGALSALCGYGTSVIGCDAEVGLDQILVPGPLRPGSRFTQESPDGRRGAVVLAFAFNGDKLGEAVANRVGQGVLTAPTAAVFDGLPDAAERLPLGGYLRYFGDGHEARDGDTWRIPVMEGDVAFPATIGVERGVAGGNLIFQGADQPTTLDAAKRAVAAAFQTPGVITPFPGGVCRSGSKVGSRYQRLVASTNEAFCPTLTGAVETKLVPGAVCAYEVILNGVDERAVRAAMRAALHAAPDEGLLAITAGEYGGKLGKIRIPLHELLE